MEILLPGLCAAFILVGIHAYLGIHVMERGVIFVDLAMAQSATLGTLVGFLLYGEGPQHLTTYLFSLGFTIFHALMFAMGRSKNSRVPDEAVIGLTYAILSALSMLLVDGAPHGAERIRDMLVGQVLWVSWDTVLKTGLLYGAVGIFHYVFRERFLLVSSDPEAAEASGISVPFWDFLFYATFGLIITSSVAIGGVLLVFTLLVGPALLGGLYARSIRGRLLIGYATGFLVTLLGFFISFHMDLPTGASVVVLFGVVLAPLGIVRYVVGRVEGRAIRLSWVAVWTVLFVFVLGGLWWFRPHKHHHEHTHSVASSSAKTPKSSQSNGGMALSKKQKGKSQRGLLPPQKRRVKDGTILAQREVSKPTLKPHKRFVKLSQVAPRTSKISATKQKTKSPLSLANEKNGQRKKAEILRLLGVMEGRNEEPLLDRRAAFLRLCKLTEGRFPSCPFSGNLFELSGWLKSRSLQIRRMLRPKTRALPSSRPSRRPRLQPSSLPK